MKVCIYTNGGGEGVLATDALESLGLEIPETPDNLKQKLSKVLDNFASFHNPIDTTAQASEEQYVEGLKIILNDDYFDGILAILLPQLPWYTQNFINLFKRAFNKQKPVIFVIYGGLYAKTLAEALDELVPVFESPIQAAKAFWILSKLKERC